MAAGALGYVIKQRMASDLVAAIKEAHAGRPFLGLGGKNNSGGVAP
jgi:DNA-binding NarL/FixJ family response regulator